MLTSNQNFALERLKGEFIALQRSPNVNFGITVGLINQNDFYHWRATISGPKDSSYKVGRFILTIDFPKDYPNHAPEVCFKTPIYHVNVNPVKSPNGDRLGHVCISTLNWWKPEYKIREVLCKIYALFYMANPSSPYGLERGIELRDNKELYEEKVKYFTDKYANPGHCNIDKDYNDSWDFTYK